MEIPNVRSFIYFWGSYRTPPSLRKLQSLLEGEGVAELWTFSGSNEKVQKEKIISKTTRQ